MKQYILPFLVGVVVTFVLLKVLAKMKKPQSEDKTFKNFTEVAKTPEAAKLVKTKEFKEVIRTKEFNKFATEFGIMQLSEFIQV